MTPFRRKAATAAETMWPLLFGTVPLNAWPPGDATEGITGQFAAARAAYHSGQIAAAQEIWRSIATDQSLESRHVLQAWSFLRGSGIEPPSPVDAQVLGVVVEVPVFAAATSLLVKVVSLSG